ncbi:MAG: tRNA pseudouridine(13) synthase TruD [Candidatus Micrarchaeota archaeon]|nr:tRNA pseudouridine(13) synthase TruD [Candidatus Micrarchaeota archaeon]
MQYLSKISGIGGLLDKTPESFIVNEITENGTILESGRAYTADELGMKQDESGKFAIFVLQKYQWNTIQALQTVGRRLGRGVKSVGYAGLKDRQSTSTQLASLFGADSKKLAELKAKDITINGAWQSSKGVEMGELLGNSFSVKIKDCNHTERVDEIVKELDGKFPNYFDGQRFGARLNNSRVGVKIMQGDIEGAAIEFLTATSNERNEDAVNARKQLAQNMDFAEALGYFPGYLKLERTVLYYLSKEGRDFAKAMRSIPRGISIMFIHAVEALVFNCALEMMVKEENFKDAKLHCGLNFYGFPDATRVSEEAAALPILPLIGYETKEGHISEYEEEVLDKLGIKPADFKISSMPELSMRGAYRPALSTFKDFSSTEAEGSVNVRFSLPSGSYATVFIGEIIKGESLDMHMVEPRLKPA